MKSPYNGILVRPDSDVDEPMTFHDLFHTPDAARKQFMAEVLNLFSHDIVRCWMHCRI